MIEEHKPNLVPARYFVCWFDSLATRHQLLSGIDLNDPRVSGEKLLEISRHAYVTHEFLSGIWAEINEVRKCPSAYVDNHCSNIDTSEDIRKVFIEDASSISCGYQQFSDATMFYVRDVRDDGKLGLFSEILFEKLIVTFSLSLVRAMAKGYYYRGSMVYGTGWELDRNCLFGPVVEQAYNMEQKEAAWPRIVISEAMEARMREMARGVAALDSPAKMICLDPDGKFSLDYWSKGAVMNYLRVADSQELLKIAEDGRNNAVNAQHKFAAFDNDNGQKLYRRYCELLSYLDDRMLAKGLFKPV